VHLPTGAAVAVGAAVGVARRDVILTREEAAGLAAELLVSAEPPLGRASFRDWLARSGEGLGRRYVSELSRNFRPYAPL
jgi:NADH dehydrogenase